jgi:hypothetical protein
MPLGMQRQIAPRVVVLAQATRKISGLPHLGLTARVHDDIDMESHGTTSPCMKVAPRRGFEPRT